MIIANVLQKILTDYKDILQPFNIQASFSCWQRVQQIELRVTHPRVIRSCGTQPKFVRRTKMSLCAKFYAFFQSVAMFSLSHLTIEFFWGLKTLWPYQLTKPDFFRFRVFFKACSLQNEVGDPQFFSPFLAIVYHYLSAWQV